MKFGARSSVPTRSKTLGRRARESGVDRRETIWMEDSDSAVRFFVAFFTAFEFLEMV